MEKEVIVYWRDVPSAIAALKAAGLSVPIEGAKRADGSVTLYVSTRKPVNMEAVIVESLEGAGIDCDIRR
jgi:hypothetical protein